MQRDGSDGNEANETNAANEINAAVIIHSRTRYRDFREGLLVRPADMTGEQAYRWKKQILRCTREPEEMRTGHQVRRAVIGDGVYGAVGVAAYFRDLATGSFEDEGRRPAYGFVGLIWKIDSFFQPCTFPSMEVFQGLVESYVVPRWEEPKNTKDAEAATLSAYQECWDETAYVDADTAVRQALEQAVRGENVFYCTGLPEQISEREVSMDSGTGEKRKVAEEISNHRVKRGLVWAAAAAGLLCGAVIWALMFR